MKSLNLFGSYIRSYIEWLALTEVLFSKTKSQQDSLVNSYKLLKADQKNKLNQEYLLLQSASLIASINNDITAYTLLLDKICIVRLHINSLLSNFPICFSH